MEKSREAEVRRRAIELWERAGKRGTHEDYVPEAMRQIDDEFEHSDTPSPADKKTPLVP